MNVFLIILLMVIVALVNMITVLIIIILEKGSASWCFKVHGFIKLECSKNIFISVNKNSYCRNNFWKFISLYFGFFTKKFQFLKLDSSIYYMQHIPFDYDFFSVLLINMGTIVMCYLALIIPSSIITNMKLIDSIRFE